MNQLAIDFTAPPMARKSDPITCHQAAERAGAHASHGRMMVLRSLSALGPMSDFDLADRTGWQQTSIGKRRLECVRAGWVMPLLNGHGDQITRLSPSGSKTLVWQITPAGLEILRSS